MTTRDPAVPAQRRIAVRPAARDRVSCAVVRRRAVPNAAALCAVLIAAVCAWGPAGARAAAQPVPVAPQAPAPAAPSHSALPVDVTGAETVEYDAATETYTFVGPHVVFTRGEERLEAPEVRYDGAKRRAVVPRGGTLTGPTMVLAADVLTADLATRHMVAEGRARGRFLDAGTWATLTAARLEADDRPALRRVDASGDAVIVRGDQELRGRRVVYDRGAQRGSADGHAVAVRAGDRLEADHIEGDLAARSGEATGHVVFDRAAMHVHGTADRATYSEHDGTVVLIGNAVVTRARDRIEADRITMHVRDNLAVADGRTRVTAYPADTSP